MLLEARNDLFPVSVLRIERWLNFQPANRICPFTLICHMQFQPDKRSHAERVQRAMPFKTLQDSMCAHNACM